MRLAAILLLLGSAARADWELYRAGPTDVVTDGDERAAQHALNVFEQVRYMAARLLGQETVEPLFPVRVVLSKRAPESPGLLLGRDGYLAGSASGPVLREYARLLLEANSERLPDFVEAGLLDLLATIDADGPLITFGVPGNPTRDWARMRLLVLSDSYSGRVRVFLSNLRRDASLDVASRNAFEKPWAAVEKEADAFFAAGRFEPAVISGATIDPDRDYRKRPIDQNLARRYAGDAVSGRAPEPGELAAEATDTSRNALAWYAKGTVEKDPEAARKAYERASELNPRWAEPHARLAELAPDLEHKIPRLRKAAALNSRDAGAWERLAVALVEGRLYEDAATSYRAAERAAASENERAGIERRRRAYEEERIALEAAERRRIEEEKERELAQLKDEALGRIRQAEERANTQLRGDSPAGQPEKVVEWWERDQKEGSVTGRLERVDCLGSRARLHVKAESGETVRLLVIEPSKIEIAGAGELRLGCGGQRPARSLTVEYALRADTALGTAGDAAYIEFKE